MIQAIYGRRSIRKYRADPVPDGAVREILQAGMLAPSSKNRQPWKFIVTANAAKAEALEAMARGLEREAASPFLPESARHLSGAWHTLDTMRQAPVVIFVLNTLGADLRHSLTTDQQISEICNAQSIGAAMENMALTAADLGLGTLWICDTFFAFPELQDWLHTDIQLCAAMAVGYADETPGARPRKPFDDVVEWRC